MLLLPLTLPPSTASAGEPATGPNAQRELPDKYCITCHNYTDYEGGLELALLDPEHPPDYAQLAEKMLHFCTARHAVMFLFCVRYMAHTPLIERATI